MSVIEIWNEEDEEWEEGDREEIDDFHLTDYEKGYRFSEDDLCKFYKLDDWPEWDFNGFSHDWCGIKEGDSLEVCEKKWDDYKKKFPEISSINQFKID